MRTIAPFGALVAVAVAVMLACACEEKKPGGDSSPAPGPVASGANSVSPSVAAVAPARPKLDRAALSALQALPKSAELPTVNSEMVALGKMLYFEPRISKSQEISCASCHKLDAFGVDGEATSIGHKKQRGGRNAPTVLNAAVHFRQFWDGRAADVEEQATGPIQNPIEMASDEKRVVAVLSSIPEYVQAFKKAFPEAGGAVTLKNAGAAIAAFERKLLTPSKLDAYLAGDDAALTDDQKAGAALFVQIGCVGCHSGVGVGGAMYQKLGVVKAWPNQKDQGRFEVTKQEGDRMMFKVPSLRNIEKTAPYFHDGATATLDEAVRMMARHQLGKELKDDELKSLLSFLKALTAPPAADLVAPPTLPKSTPKTPKPDFT